MAAVEIRHNAEAVEVEDTVVGLHSRRTLDQVGFDCCYLGGNTTSVRISVKIPVYERWWWYGWRCCSCRVSSCLRLRQHLPMSAWELASKQDSEFRAVGGVVVGSSALSGLLYGRIVEIVVTLE